MAYGEKLKRYNKRGHDKEWWGNRPLSGYTISWKSKTNKFFKRLLHKIERRNGKIDSNNFEQ